MVFASRMPCAQRKYRLCIVLLLSKKGVWGLLGAPLRPAVLAGCRPCSPPTAGLASQPPSTMAPGHGPRCPALLWPNTAACSFIRLLGHFPCPVLQPKVSAQNTFPYIFSLTEAFPLGLNAWLLWGTY